MFRSLLVSLLALAPLLPGQDARELSTPAGHHTLLNVSSATITSTVNTGYRLVDIHYRGVNPVLGTSVYDATLVQNTGDYAQAWWWYSGLTATQVSTNLTTNSARLIDLEPYTDANGNLRFACIMVSNTGANNKAWWWYFNTDTTSLGQSLATNNARLVDLDSYDVGGTTYYSGVMIRNTGADARSWWWYVNVNTTQISTSVATNNAQLYDLDRRDNGNYDCIMVRNPDPASWYWWFGLTAADVTYRMGQYGVRVIDIESYLVGTARRYAMVAINNSNALSTSIGSAMRSRTDGQVGCWLQQINGSNLAFLNGDTQFEPASSMKVLHHVHAMRQVRFGLPLTTPLTVYSAYTGSCPVDSGPSTQQLQPVLQAMMEQSDNARTQAVRNYFTETSINNTATALGMASTSTNHRLGCPEGATNPNRITLRDLHTLHSQVANGYLGNQRALFYQLMLDSVSDLSIASIINTEGALLGLSSTTLASFRAFTDVAHKGGNYIFPSLATPIQRCEFGYLSLPFIVNDVITPREYSFGAFVNDATGDTDAATAIYTDAIPALLRPQIRAALLSWNNSLAGVSPFGAGCGGYSQTVGGLPRLGQTVGYNAVNGYANGPALFALGFSNTTWAGLPLPGPLAPLGSQAGCVALTDIQISAASVANNAGNATFPVSIPSPLSGIGFTYFTQMYSFGPIDFRTSNGQRSIVGL